MKIQPVDVMLGTLSTGVCLAVSLGIVITINSILFLPHGFQSILLICLFFLAYICTTLFQLWFLRFFWPLQEGLRFLGTDTQSLVWKLHGYLYIFNLGLLINAGLVPVNIRALAFSLLGSEIGKSVMIGGKILDPSLVKIGDYSMLGEDSLLTAHAVEGDWVDLGRIILGRNVTVGVKAVVLPDVQIGEGAIVAAGAVVKKGTRIGPGEIWGGVPARKIGVVGERGRDGEMERRRDGETERWRDGEMERRRDGEMGRGGER